MKKIAAAMVLFAILALFTLVLRVGAQDSDETETLARICAAEAGWDPTTGDCAAIVHLLRRRAARRRLSVDQLARAYSSEHFDARRERRRWVLGLTLGAALPDAPPPDGWPERLAWPPYRRAWARMLGVVRAPGADPCRGDAEHWGMRIGHDLERARRAGWRMLDCGPTLNAFWSTRQGGAS